MPDSRAKGRRYELEVRDELRSFAPAERISEAGLSLPDLQWLDRFVECKIRHKYFLSMNEMVEILEGDAQMVITRLDRQQSYVVMPLDELLDVLEEVRASAGQVYQ